jgi:hypothetical protein
MAKPLLVRPRMRGQLPSSSCARKTLTPRCGGAIQLLQRRDRHPAPNVGACDFRGRTEHLLGNGCHRVQGSVISGWRICPLSSTCSTTGSLLTHSGPAGPAADDEHAHCGLPLLDPADIRSCTSTRLAIPAPHLGGGTERPRSSSNPCPAMPLLRPCRVKSLSGHLAGKTLLPEADELPGKAGWILRGDVYGILHAGQVFIRQQDTGGDSCVIGRDDPAFGAEQNHRRLTQL